MRRAGCTARRDLGKSAALLAEQRELQARTRPERLHLEVLHPGAVGERHALLRPDQPHRLVVEQR